MTTMALKIIKKKMDIIPRSMERPDLFISLEACSLWRMTIRTRMGVKTRAMDQVKDDGGIKQDSGSTGKKSLQIDSFKINFSGKANSIPE